MECVDSDEEGNPEDLIYQRYEKLYQGGFGLVDLEAITVTNESRARKTQLEIVPNCFAMACVRYPIMLHYL